MRVTTVTTSRADDVAGASITSNTLASRRDLLIGAATAIPMLLSRSAYAGDAIEVLEDVPGVGTRGARRGDLLLFHYVGKLADTGEVFDSTRGGLTYRDGGPGVFRPVAVALGSGPVPGICVGLQQALEGMAVGGRRRVRVPASLGFGPQPVLAPYAVVPGGSAVEYEVELLRLSARGPDALTQGIAKCGQGGMGQQTELCRDIAIAEYL
ncbi:hypothetical protein HYH03_012737 [Edaphochlamys debaryana]|uniref:peptidylprolyl isomerase n=1 Tax=Edaphochlamys debaryana TaxID=47281 RepID=A0A835XTI8_9CHLO|nr:hypothetical protein HYH03_012737 [Edaphochlamys debaryana]|eukprot:KAG2488738.1 hypothetical protein HYH03_012737 [Edaphochlamys debaryana]